MFYVKHEMIVICLSLQSVDLTRSSLSMEASDSEDDQVTQAHTNHTPYCISEVPGWSVEGLC